MLPGSENILSFVEFYIAFQLINIGRAVEIPHMAKWSLISGSWLQIMITLESALSQESWSDYQK